MRLHASQADFFSYAYHIKFFHLMPILIGRDETAVVIQTDRFNKIKKKFARVALNHLIRECLYPVPCTAANEYIGQK